MKRLADPRYVVFAVLFLVTAGLISYAAFSAATERPTPTPTTNGLALVPTATMSSLLLTPPLPLLATPNCALTLIDAGAAINELDASGRAVQVRLLQTVRNECTGEVLTRDAVTGELAPCATLVTIPAEPAYRLNPTTGREEQVGAVEMLTDFSTGKFYGRDPVTGEIFPTTQVATDGGGLPDPP